MTYVSFKIVDPNPNALPNLQRCLRIVNKGRFEIKIKVHTLIIVNQSNSVHFS